MGRIETFAQPQEAGKQSVSVAEIPTSVGSSATALTDDLCKQSLTERMTVEKWQSAISKADDLIDLFEAEARCFDALWRQHSDFGHKADYDCALSNEHKARELRDALVRKLKEHQA